MSELITKNMPEPETDEMVALWARAHMNEFLPDEWQRKSAVPWRIFNIARDEALDKARQSLSAHDAQIRAEAWEEGRIAEHDEAYGWGDAINPYRKEVQQ